MATYSSLKTEIENNGWTVVNETTGNTANQITSKTITGGKIVNGALKTKTFAIAKYEVNGEHYWQDADPFQDSTWYQELQTYLKTVVDGDNPFEAAFIVNINGFMERGRVLAVYDNSGTIEDRYYLLWKDSNGDIQNVQIDSPIT